MKQKGFLNILTKVRGQYKLYYRLLWHFMPKNFSHLISLVWTNILSLAEPIFGHACFQNLKILTFDKKIIESTF